QAQAAVLRPRLQKSLPDYMVPSAFVVLDRLPLSPNGKLDRKALPAPEFGTFSLDQPYEAPRDALEVELCRLWEEALGIPCIGIRQNFFELGGYSLMAVALVNKIRRRLSVNIPVAVMFEAPTIAELAPILRRSGTQSSDNLAHNLVLPYRTKGTRAPFFCIHAASGTVLGYASLARGLSADQPFYAVQARGVEGEADPLTSVAEMADTYVPEIRRIQPHGPYFLGGWSIGGLISLEMSRRLQAQGETVGLVTLFDSIVPLGFDWESRNGARDATLILAALLARLDESDPPPNLHKLSSDEQLKVVIDVARRAGRVPPDFTLEQVRHQMRVLQVNLEADLEFIPGPYSGRVLLFRAEDAIGRPSPEIDAGWSPYMPELETVVVPGDHYSMLLEPANAATVARLLEARLISEAQNPFQGSARALAAVHAHE
ncbi:MAG TPA: alpha/beta fold hydrolase, partial [Bryobacteraceae bacterium]|nr:alpha/beta fold hydrolase [Bryobacteraceae bacterium]